MTNNYKILWAVNNSNSGDSGIWWPIICRFVCTNMEETNTGKKKQHINKYINISVSEHRMPFFTHTQTSAALYSFFGFFFKKEKVLLRTGTHDAGVMKDLRCRLYTKCLQCAYQDWSSACNSGPSHVTNKRFLPTPKHASYKPGYTMLQLRRLVFVSETAALHSRAGFLLVGNERIHRNNMIK